MIRQIVFGCIGSVALDAAAATSASAADLRAPVYKAPPPPPAIFSWTGFYIGGHVGGVFGDKDWTDVTTLPGVAVGSHDISGVIAGGQIGFNWQTGNWVWGVEGQMSWTNADGDHVEPSGLFRDSTEMNWLGTAAVRLGYALDRVLLYVKGGAAFVNEDFATAGLPGNILIATHNDETRVGWMVGAGVEWALWDNWSAKIEYNFMDFGNDTFGFDFVPPLAGHCCDFDIDQQLHVVKFGINYRFGGGAPVVARY
jgi:outer membrane immunogenic protein